MQIQKLFPSCAIALAMMVIAIPAGAQTKDAAAWVARFGSEYTVNYGIPYQFASDVELKLDVYSPRGVTAPNATVINYHGGGRFLEGAGDGRNRKGLNTEVTEAQRSQRKANRR